MSTLAWVEVDTILTPQNLVHLKKMKRYKSANCAR